MNVITYETCIKIYTSRVNAGTLRDPNLLKSAIETPDTAFGGISLYPTVIQKAARLAYGISQAQAFTDGNKRLAWLCMITFLSANGLKLSVGQEQAAELLLKLANKELSLEDFSDFLNSHIE
ncbi:MAG: type II toxin-antitoxin system death-on-curing family toxin [Actinomycetaceae bacterium]|nr:type II toxin-antitoxin system death-on-curing family toxin [Actinomycetaceae bacterium]